MIDWGIKDSKLFGSLKASKQARERLARKIANEFKHAVIAVPASEIDGYVKEKKLNLLERETALKIMEKIPADQVILDGANLFKPIARHNVKAFNKADSKYLSVSAASILAKAERDRLFGQLCRKYEESFGEIKGGGYPNANTLKFVAWHLRRYGTLPPFYRKSYQWKKLNQFLDDCRQE